MQLRFKDSVTLKRIHEHSFRNFHAKGFDYICLKRTPDLTKKVYFFEGDIRQASEVVNPHNHRYNFDTKVLSGELLDFRYTTGHNGTMHNLFNWYTPLNGGDGFHWVGGMRLVRDEPRILKPNHMPYPTCYKDIHTIRVNAPDTVLLLTQYHDQFPADRPTQTFTTDHLMSPLDGLYEKFTMDQLIKRLRQINYLMGTK